MTLFVNSRDAFFPNRNRASVGNSPKLEGGATANNSTTNNFLDTQISGKGFLASVDLSTCDYKTLKLNKSLIGKVVLDKRSTSISQARIDREFNPSGVSKDSKNKQRRGSTEAANNA